MFQKSKKIIWGILFLIAVLALDYRFVFLPIPGTYSPAPDIPLMGHRGAGELAPENTLPSLDSALAYKLELIEIDVQRTSDNVIVLMHDQTINRTSNNKVKGKISELTWDEIKNVDVGSYFSPAFSSVRIPTLEATLQHLKKHNQENNTTSSLVIEVKDPEIYPGIEEQIIKIIDTLGMKDQSYVISFNIDFIKEMNGLDPTLQLGCLYLIPPKRSAPELEFIQFISVHSLVGSIFMNRVKKTQKKGVKAWAWTVNSLKKMKRLRKRGFDGIVTDYPNLVSK